MYVYIYILYTTFSYVWWVCGPTTRLLLVLHCGCPIFTFCGLCTCGCHPFQQYPAVFCLLAFLNRWFGKLFFYAKWTHRKRAIGWEYIGKVAISQAWWVKFFHYQAALVIVLVDMFITPLAVAMFSDATGMRRSMLSMAARLFTMWLAAVLSTLYLTTHCMNGWAQLWNVSGWQSGQQIGCCNAKLLGMTKSVFLLPYFGVPYCWRNFGKREPKMVDKIVPQSYNAGLY